MRGFYGDSGTGDIGSLDESVVGGRTADGG